MTVVTTIVSGATRPDFLKHRLLSEVKTVAPGQTFTVALFLDHDEDFHTYWQNPGTVGLATSLKWELPSGFKAGPIQWQAPEKVKMVTYDAHGYNCDATLLVDITAPETLSEDGVELKAKAVWMVCGPEPKLCCNMGFKNLSLELKTSISTEWDEVDRSRIQEARKRIPQVLDGWEHGAKRMGEKVVLTVWNTMGMPVSSDDDLYFYSESNHFTTLAEQRNKVEENELVVTLPVADYAPEKLGELVGLLFHPKGWPGTNGKKYMPVSLSLD
jgi:DsbC/DsbD-like thiol-disulfide interchange protein